MAPVASGMLALAGAALAAAHPAPILNPIEPVSTPAAAAPVVPRVVTMSVGAGQLVPLSRAIKGVFVADDKIADVQVKDATSIYIFAKSAGLTTIYATDARGAVVWSSDVRVGVNMSSVGALIRAAMPDQDIIATPMAGMILLTGTVVAPADAEEAQRLVEQMTAGSVQILNRLKVATPQQVNLRVKIAEIDRNLLRQIGVNLANRASGNPIFSIAQGTPGTITTNTTGLAADGSNLNQTVNTFTQLAGTTLGIAGHAFGADFLATLQLNETNGLITTLAEPNLVALSGESASFLAGGEIPIPESQGLGTVSVNYKQYGVSLSFTPTVMSNGHIMLRVRPEVSQLSDVGAVTVNNFKIPAFITRRADTTVELGSGQSFAIGGLLQNSHNNSVTKAPLLGDLPVIGALFRSNSFQKNETELVIVVTPYLVKGVDANRIALPTDGYRAPTTVERVLEDKVDKGTSGARRPEPAPAPVPVASAAGAPAIPTAATAVTASGDATVVRTAHRTEPSQVATPVALAALTPIVPIPGAPITAVTNVPEATQPAVPVATAAATPVIPSAATASPAGDRPELPQATVPGSLTADTSANGAAATAVNTTQDPPETSQPAVPAAFAAEAPVAAPGTPVADQSGPSQAAAPTAPSRETSTDTGISIYTAADASTASTPTAHP